jgi:hypothetical protein
MVRPPFANNHAYGQPFALHEPVQRPRIKYLMVRHGGGDTMASLTPFCRKYPPWSDWRGKIMHKLRRIALAAGVAVLVCVGIAAVHLWQAHGSGIAGGRHHVHSLTIAD